jgi:hypothetical protein
VAANQRGESLVAAGRRAPHEHVITRLARRPGQRLVWKEGLDG